jgi:hypothetical protein
MRFRHTLVMDHKDTFIVSRFDNKILKVSIHGLIS